MKKYRTETISKKKAIFIVIVGLVFATSCVFLMPEQQSPVQYSEAVAEEGIFTRSEVINIINPRKHGIPQPDGIRLYFEDGRTFEIDSSSYSDELAKKLHFLPSGTEVSMLLHPNSDCILDLRTEDEVLLEFDDGIKNLTSEVKFFRILGFVMYGFAAVIIFDMFLHPKNYT